MFLFDWEEGPGWTSTCLSPSNTANSACFTPCGTAVITASWLQKELRRWDLASKHSKLIGSHRVSCDCVAVCPDRIAYVTSDKVVEVIPLVDHDGDSLASQPTVMRGHKSWIWAVAFSSSGSRLASSSEDGTVRVWSSTDGLCLQTLPIVTGRNHNIAFSPLDDALLACGSMNTKASVQLWDWSKGKTVRTFASNESDITHVSFAADGSTLVSGHPHTVRIWNFDHENDVRIIHTGFSPDFVAHLHTGSLIAFTKDSLKLCHIDAPSFIPPRIGAKSPITDTALAFSEDMIATAHADGTMSIWKLRNDRVTELLTCRNHSAVVSSVCFSRDSKLLASASDDKTICVYQSSDVNSPPLVLRGHSYGVRYVSFSNNSRLLGSCSKDSTAIIWDAATGAVLHKLEKHKDSVHGLAFLFDDSHVMTISNDKKCFLWNIASSPAAVVQTIEFNATPYSCATSPDGNTLALGFREGMIELLPASDAGRCLDKAYSTQLRGGANSPFGKVHKLSYSLDGRYLLSSTYDQYSAIWCVEKQASSFLRDGDVRSVRGGHACLGRTHVILSTEADLIYVPHAFFLQQFYWLRTLIRYGTVEQLAWFLDKSTLTHHTRLSFGILDVCDVISATLVGKQWTKVHLQQYLSMYPATQIINIQFGVFTAPRNALQVALRNKQVAHAEVLVGHITARLAHQPVNSPWLEDEGLVLTHSLTKLASEYPKLAVTVLDTTCRLLPTQPDLGDKKACTWELHNSAAPLTYTGDESVVCKLVMLPHLADRGYWHQLGLADPLKALARTENIEAFRTEALRATLHQRWQAMRGYFVSSFGLFIFYLASVVAFSLYVATDNVSLSLAERYSTGLSRTSLAFGYIALILTFIYILARVTEVYYGGAGALIEFWAIVDVLSHLLVLAVAIFHGLRSESEYLVTCLAVLCLWFKLLSFLRGFRGSGVFVRLMFAIGYEIRWFILVWFLIILGFTNAYVILYRASDPSFATMGVGFVDTFAGALFGVQRIVRDGAETDFAPSTLTHLYNFQLVLFVCFSLVCNVLLINMLIALMSSKFAAVTEAAGSHYRMEKTKLMLGLENLCFNTVLRKSNQGLTAPWLFVVAPTHADMWKAHGYVKEDDVARQLQRLQEQNEELRAQMAQQPENIAATLQKINSVSV